MRRAQSVRHYTRASVPTIGSNDLGVLKEAPEESTEVALRRQLLDKSKENDKLRDQIQALQTQLAQRPPIEAIQELRKEYSNLELILQGTQRENERAMTELERGRQREKLLERELEKLAGSNWQANLKIAPVGVSSPLPSRTTAALFSPPMQHADGNLIPKANVEATMAHVEQVRLLVLGMEERLRVREDKLVKTMEKADQESHRFEVLRKEAQPAKS
ncbi:hypothetical protein DFH94DRAFT_732626 [Russula ochroleuca]|uniref:Uncharacterized protein n=1 Tax=Russula ochroleuca TaxID=152965 RepID=A0A9P5MYF6_9AGAM|nr:hypothetical protein DFH94DRAFT_732626 [Russula ochroleuca]